MTYSWSDFKLAHKSIIFSNAQLHLSSELGVHADRSCCSSVTSEVADGKALKRWTGGRRAGKLRLRQKLEIFSQRKVHLVGAGVRPQSAAR